MAQLEAQERYRSLCNDVHSMVYTHDLQGKLTYANPAALRSFGYSLEEVVGMNVMDLLDPNEDLRVKASTEEIVRTGIQSLPDKYHLRRKDGTFLIIETTGSLLYNDGRPSGVIGIARDITDREMAADATYEAKQEAQPLFLDHHAGHTEPDHVA